MSDFVQTMKDWRRMCEHCERNEKIGCVVNGNVCAGFFNMKDDIDPEVVEANVTAWAAEHPEPVYPTWFEWLEQIKVAGRAYELEPYFTGNKEGYLKTAAFTPKAFEPIPADIAQKLGIEPKEGI